MTEPRPQPPSNGPRRALVLGVGAVAAAAGLGWSMRSPSPAAPEATAADAGSRLPADFWGLSFEQPDGAVLALSSLRGRRLVLNFWATWCPPCVRELPLFDDFHRQRESQGWTVVGLAIDSPTPVRSFLQRTPVSFPVGLAGLGGSELGKRLGNGQGGLPFTVVVAADGRIVHRQLGETSAQDLQRWAGMA